jgi:hypothetical protein
MRVADATLAGHVHTTGFNNATSPADSAAGDIAITTVNGNITTVAGATLDAVGGDNDDLDGLPNGEGGIILLTANDPGAVNNVGSISIGASINTSTELAKPIRVSLNAEENVAINAAIVTLGGGLAVSAGRDITSNATGTLTTTGDKIDEDSGDVSLSSTTVALAGSVTLLGNIDTSGVSNTASTLDSDAGLVTIATVNGNITTAAIDARGGTTTDLTIRGEGGIVTLTANDGAGAIDTGNVTLSGSLQTSTEVAAVNVNIDAAQDANINAPITTLGGEVTIDAGRNITSNAAGDITTTGDQIDEDSGNVTLNTNVIALAGSVTLLGDIDTGGFDNSLSTLDSDAGLVTIATVNGNITTAAIDARGGTTTDLTIRGEGGIVTLTANDGAGAIDTGNVTLSGSLQTSTEVAAINVNIDAAQDANINAPITTLGGEVTIDAGRNITSNATGDITTTGDQIDEDSGDVTLDTNVVALAGSIILAGDIDTSGFDNAASALDSDAGLVTITTVNGNIITTAAIDARGGTTNDPLIMGEGGVVTLDANDGDASGTDGSVSVNGSLQTSTETAAVNVILVADRVVSIFAPISTLGGTVDVDAGLDITTSPAGDITTTGDKPNEDSGDVTLFAGRDASLQGRIDTSGFNNVSSPADSAGGEIAIWASRDIRLIGAVLDSLGGDNNDPDVLPNAVGGHITLLALDDIVLQNNATLTTNGVLGNSGTAYLFAANTVADAVSGVDMQAGSAVSTSGGNIRVVADNEGDIRLAALNAGPGDVSLLAERSILDNNGTATNVTANALRMWADAVVNPNGTQNTLIAGNNLGTIGQADTLNGTPAVNINAIDTQVATLAAHSAQGIYVSEFDAITVEETGDITVQQVDLGLSLTPRTDLSLADLTTTASGPIKLASQNGEITLNDGVAAAINGNNGISVRAHSTLDPNGVGSPGSILIEARGAASDLTVNADVVTWDGTAFTSGDDIAAGRGHITLIAGDDVLQNADVLTDGTLAASGVEGSVEITALNGTLDGAGADGVIMANDTSTTTFSGSIRVVADNESDIQLGFLDTVDETAIVPDFTTGAVSLVAERSILDGAGDLAELNLQTGTLLMIADASLSNASNQEGTIGLADAGNGTPSQNINAIDTQVVALAARSADGIYVSELDAVTVDTASVTIQRVNFNSTLSPITDTLSDLTTTDNGAIKLVALDGTITVNDGADGDALGVESQGTGDILLEAREILAADIRNIVTTTGVSSSGGHISLIAADNIDVGDDVRTTLAGTIYIAAQNGFLTIADSADADADGIRSVDGDVLLTALTDVTLNATVNSGTGDVGVIAGNDVLQNANITTAGNVLVEAGNDIVMGVGASSGGGQQMLYRATGTITLGSLGAMRVAIDAGGSIVDGNGGAVNATATDLSMRAGGIIGGPDVVNPPGTNVNAIDTNVVAVAADSTSGIYIHEISNAGPTGNLTVNRVEAVTVSVDVERVHFNSTRSDVNASDAINALEDLTTVNSTIEVIVSTGSLTLIDGSDAGTEVIHAGSATGTATNLSLAATTGQNQIVVTSTLGFAVGDTILVDDGDSPFQSAKISAIVANTLTLSNNLLNDYSLGSTVVKQAAVNLSAGTSIASELIPATTSTAIVQGDHLSLYAGTASSGYVHLPDTQVATMEAQIATAVNAALQTTAFQNAVANSTGDDFLDFLTQAMIDQGVAPGSAEFQAVLAAIASRQPLFNYAGSQVTAGGYTFFTRNDGALSVGDVSVGPGANPHVYIETLGNGDDLTVEGSIDVISNTADEGRIVLIAGDNLTLATGATLTTTTGEVNSIGPLIPIVGQPGNNVNDATFFDGGTGIAPDFSTKFVIDLVRFNDGGENFETRLLQQVVIDFGSPSEQGFLSIISYADGLVEDFNTQPQLAGVTAFTRSTAFNSNFLNSNVELPTTAILRRADDFFLFEDGGATDLTAEAKVIEDVFGLGTGIGFVLPAEPLPIQAPFFVAQPIQTVIDLPPLPLPVSIELPIAIAKNVEVAIYQVKYVDDNSNGQVEADELPSYQQVLRDIQEEGLSEESVKERVPIESEKGGNPTQEEIARAKNRLLNDPNQPSGAYAIIAKEPNGDLNVIDVFGIRDWPEVVPDTSGQEAEVIVPQIEPFNPADLERAQQPSDDGAEVVPAAPEAAVPQDSDSSWLQPASHESQRLTRWGSSGLLLGTLWMMHSTQRDGQAASSQTAEPPADHAVRDYSRRARRRRWLR